MTRTALRVADRAPEDASRTLRDLASALAQAIEGEVRFGRGDRAVYSTDASNYRHLPLGVVVPRSTEDVVATVRLCADARVPIVARGGGTSLAGQACNEAVVIDVSKYLPDVLEIDERGRTARVQPGVVLDHLRARAGEVGLTFAPDPATHDHCTLGGMIGNDSCGVHSLLSEFDGPGPRTTHNVRELDVLTPDGVRMRVGPASDAELDATVAAGGRRGEIYAALRALRDRNADLIRSRYPRIARRVSGYNLEHLLPEHGFDVAKALVGSEGTCVTILEATVELVPWPAHRTTILLGFEDVFAAADAVPAIRDLRPIGLEGFDDHLVDDNRRKRLNTDAIERLPDGAGWLIVEVGGDNERDAEDRARDALGRLRRLPGLTGSELLKDAKRSEQMWGVRESGLGATAIVPGKPPRWEGWEDAAVPPERLGEYLRGFRGLLDRFGYEASLYGHFGQGCVHSRATFDLASREGIATFRAFVTEAAELVVGLGGSLSGEHGDGQARAELLPMMFGDELVRTFEQFKRIWDPAGLMNPGRIVSPEPLDSGLRLGAAYAPPAVSTRFAYPEDGGSFAHAALRCVGVGKCRRTEGGAMCPSYRVTRDEEHSTRGRARLLFEMLNGSELELWRSDEVKEALDLCLACKACKSECPVNVDMATYKAEFLSHYYEGRRRPRIAYAMGLLPWWARVGSRVPRLANAALSLPVIGRLAKRAGGIAPERSAPAFADETFRTRFARRPSTTTATGERVVLWPDTFTDRFHPEVGTAAVEVLERAGARVELPRAWACCGRPLYDHGMLDLARRLLRRTVDVLRPAIRDGVPIVVLEPSCAAVFRDELPSMLVGDEDAAALSRQVVTLAQYLDRSGYAPPRIDADAIVQTHCHQEAVVGTDADRRILDALGIRAREPEEGCCGMAGAFGFEAGRPYETSIRIAEQALLPAVRDADHRTLVIADGFSCRMQIEQGSGRRPMHLAEVLAEAVRRAEAEGGSAPP
ncbi:MAG: FAD-binding and (Fe-S)-binding domain-containing protein [Actinomycetota bacterium]